MKQRFLVTGGAGYVGSHLVTALLDRGDEVTVLDNLRTGHRAAVPAGVRLVVADLADGAATDAVVGDGPWDAVLHFAALSQVGESMRMPMRYLLDNAANGIRLIDACCPRPPRCSTSTAMRRSPRTPRSTRSRPTATANG